MHPVFSLIPFSYSLYKFKNGIYFIQLEINNKLTTQKLLVQHLPTVGYRIPDCSYLAWLDLTALSFGENPAEVLLATGKVAVNSGITFGPESGQFVRLNFATSEEIIEEAISRILSCVK